VSVEGKERGKRENTRLDESTVEFFETFRTGMLSTSLFGEKGGSGGFEEEEEEKTNQVSISGAQEMVL
jgi:hypothetical protein